MKVFTKSKGGIQYVQHINSNNPQYVCHRLKRDVTFVYFWVWSIFLNEITYDVTVENFTTVIKIQVYLMYLCLTFCCVYMCLVLLICIL